MDGYPHLITIDEFMWKTAIYLLIMFFGITGYFIKRMVASNEKIADSVIELAKDVAAMKANSDNTKEQLHKIVDDVDEIREKTISHEKRIYQLERERKVS